MVVAARPTLVVAALLGLVTLGHVQARQVPGTAAQPSAPVEHRWTMDELLPAVSDLGTGRDWMTGGRVFQQAGCGTCHAFSTYWEGNGLAPDLTGVGSKYTRDFILQSILEPSATLNGQYFHTEFTLKDGTVIRGSVLDIVDKKFIVAPVMMNLDVTVEVPQADVTSEKPSPVSPMPAGLLNAFSKAQIIELLAFLDAGGRQDAGVYKK